MSNQAPLSEGGRRFGGCGVWDVAVTGKTDLEVVVLRGSAWAYTEYGRFTIDVLARL